MNGNNFSEITTDFITLDEHGKVVVQDDNLAKINKELTLDELEKISGSFGNNCRPQPPGAIDVNLICCK